MAGEAPRTRLVGVIAERTPALVRSEAERNARRCDLLEIRLDHLEGSPPVRDIFASLPRPAIATCRRPGDGGLWRGTERA